MSQRQEKIIRIIRDTVSEVIQNRISDPRVKGLVSITHIQLAGDLSKAQVYLSILGTTARQQQTTLTAIQHARGYIQSYLANVLTIRTCPHLHFYLDDSLKKGLEMVKLLDQLEAESRARQQNQSQSPGQLQNQTQQPEDYIKPVAVSEPTISKFPDRQDEK